MAFANRHIQGQQDRGRGVDGHRGRNASQVDALEQPLHILDGINRYAHLAHFAYGQRMVRIQTNLGGQVESDRKPRGPVCKQIFVAPV